MKVCKGRQYAVVLFVIALLQVGCASVNVERDGKTERFWMPPGVNVVRTELGPDTPVAVETRGFGVTLTRSGAYFGVVRETVVLLPNDGSCRVVQLQAPKSGDSGREWLADLCGPRRAE